MKQTNSGEHAHADVSKQDKLLFEMIVEVLRREGHVTFTTYGKSMQPLIFAGDLVKVRGCSVDQVRIGDVILLDSGHAGPKRLLHRVLKIKKGPDGVQIYTKGDSSPRDRQHFTEQNLLGKAVALHEDGREYRLDGGMWRILGYLLATLSAFQALFTDGFIWFRKKDFTHQILPQRLALSTMKRVVRAGKFFSRCNGVSFFQESLHA